MNDWQVAVDKKRSVSFKGVPHILNRYLTRFLQVAVDKEVHLIAAEAHSVTS